MRNMIIEIEIFQGVILSALIQEESSGEMQATIQVKNDGIVAEMKLTKALIEEAMKELVTLIKEEMGITAIETEGLLIGRSPQEILKSPEGAMIEHLHMDLEVTERNGIEALWEIETKKAGMTVGACGIVIEAVHPSTAERATAKQQGQIVLFSLEQIPFQ